MGRKAENDWKYWRDTWESVRGQMSLREFCQGNELPYRTAIKAFCRLENSGYVPEKVTNFKGERHIMEQKELSEKLAGLHADYIRNIMDINGVVSRLLQELAQKEITEIGDIRDTAAALKTLHETLTKIQPIIRASFLQARRAEILQKLIDGEIDAIEAGLYFELMGHELPEAVRLLMQRTAPPEPEIDDDGVPDDILNADYEKAMADVERQRAEWLPERREKVAVIKKELAGKGEFGSDVASENQA